jgi:hypothetical protein
MLRRVTWRSWAVIAAALGTYTALGLLLGGNGAVEGALYKWGLLGASLAPLLLILVYTITGNRWYGNDVGSAIVQVKLCIILFAAPLAWVFFFQGGMLRPGFVAWAEVSAPALVTLALLRLCYVFWRVHRDGNSAPPGPDDEET